MQAVTHWCNASPHGYFAASLPWVRCSIFPMGVLQHLSHGYFAASLPWVLFVYIQPGICLDNNYIPSLLFTCMAESEAFKET